EAKTIHESEELIHVCLGRVPDRRLVAFAEAEQIWRVGVKPLCQTRDHFHPGQLSRIPEAEAMNQDDGEAATGMHEAHPITRDANEGLDMGRTLGSRRLCHDT